MPAEVDMVGAVEAAGGAADRRTCRRSSLGGAWRRPTVYGRETTRADGEISSPNR
jgi:hypothetical protein